MGDPKGNPHGLGEHGKLHVESNLSSGLDWSPEDVREQFWSQIQP